MVIYITPETRCFCTWENDWWKAERRGDYTCHRTGKWTKTKTISSTIIERLESYNMNQYQSGSDGAGKYYEKV